MREVESSRRISAVVWLLLIDILNQNMKKERLFNIFGEKHKIFLMARNPVIVLIQSSAVPRYWYFKVEACDDRFIFMCLKTRWEEHRSISVLKSVSIH